MDYLSMVEIEYAAMREEIHMAHSHLFITLQLFYPIVGVLLGISAENATDRIILHIILAIGIPVISLSSITFVLSECIRMKRAGDYICIIETKVSQLGVSLYGLNQFNQEKIEHQLKLSHSDISLSRPLAFESWIRDLSLKKSLYGRASIILQLRFIILFLIPTLTMVTSLCIGIYDLQTPTNLLSVVAEFRIQLLGILISLIWGIPILICGFRFSKQSTTQKPS